MDKRLLVEQNYCDEDPSEIATKVQTIQRFSHLLPLRLACSMPGMKLFICDITQDYLQSQKDLEREVIIRAPPELGIPR